MSEEIERLKAEKAALLDHTKKAEGWTKFAEEYIRQLEKMIDTQVEVQYYPADDERGAMMRSYYNRLLGVVAEYHRARQERQLAEWKSQTNNQEPPA